MMLFQVYYLHDPLVKGGSLNQTANKIAGTIFRDSLLAALLMLILPEDFDLHDGGAEVSGSQGFDQ